MFPEIQNSTDCPQIVPASVVPVSTGASQDIAITVKNAAFVKVIKLIGAAEMLVNLEDSLYLHQGGKWRLLMEYQSLIANEIQSICDLLFSFAVIAEIAIMAEDLNRK